MITWGGKPNLKMILNIEIMKCNNQETKSLKKKIVKLPPISYNDTIGLGCIREVRISFTKVGHLIQ